MQLTDNALTVLKRRYLKKIGDEYESPDDMFMRVAMAVGGHEYYREFYHMMTNLDFLPNSPTLMNAGRDLGQLSACFVLPVGDSIPEIFDAVKHAAMIHKSGGGTGFSFSRLRPANDSVQSTSGVSSGPISFMQVFNAATETIKQGGTRRGANMGLLRVDHPDVLDFIMCKDKSDTLNNFNISIALTDVFMKAVNEDTDYDLVNPKDKKVFGQLSARKVFNRLVAQAWKNGEPGVVFIDTINKANPVPHLGEIEATNPCGEQPLLPYESCNLGSINLSNMVIDKDINWRKLFYTIQLAVRFLDNVIDINKYPLEEIKEATLRTRKIGLGVMGWADMLIKLGIVYGSPESYETAQKVMCCIRDSARRASEKLTGYNEQRKNATVTTIAPTGTISIIAGCSSGIEPLYAVAYERRVLDNDVLIEVHPLFREMEPTLSDDAMKVMSGLSSIQGVDFISPDVQRIFVTAHDISVEKHIFMQAAFQKYTDNAVSKTINFPHSATEEDVAKAFLLAYEKGCKGVTVYRDGSRDHQVLSTKRGRPKALVGKTYQLQTGCGQFYVTINEDKDGIFELFATIGKAGGCAASQAEALGRMVSLAWRSRVEARQVIKQLRGISCHSPSGFGEKKVLSCADAVAQAIEYHMRDNGKEIKVEVIRRKGACPDCGGNIEHEGGCAHCRGCGYSECS